MGNDKPLKADDYVYIHPPPTKLSTFMPQRSKWRDQLKKTKGMYRKQEHLF